MAINETFGNVCRVLCISLNKHCCPVRITTHLVALTTTDTQHTRPWSSVMQPSSSTEYNTPSFMSLMYHWLSHISIFDSIEYYLCRTLNIRQVALREIHKYQLQIWNIWIYLFSPYEQARCKGGKEKLLEVTSERKRLRETRLKRDPIWVTSNSVITNNSRL